MHPSPRPASHPSPAAVVTSLHEMEPGDEVFAARKVEADHRWSGRTADRVARPRHDGSTPRTSVLRLALALLPNARLPHARRHASSPAAERPPALA